MTNQWHFYVITNTFGVFPTRHSSRSTPMRLSRTRCPSRGWGFLAAPRPMPRGTRTLTCMSPPIRQSQIWIRWRFPIVLSARRSGRPSASISDGASLGRGTTEFVVDTNSQSRSPNVYYVGVKSEDQMAAEYGFFAIFSQTPFSQMNNGNQVVNGLPVPVNIPDGSPALPGKQYVFGIAIYPMNVGVVTVSDSFTHQNFGDLIGTLTLNGAHPDVLNNHDSFGNPPGPLYAALRRHRRRRSYRFAAIRRAGQFERLHGPAKSGRVDVDRSGRFPDANRRGGQFQPADSAATGPSAGYVTVVVPPTQFPAGRFC